MVCLEQTPEALEKALRTGPYGRCVYRCDNNVCDHMSMILEFENGVTATFSLTARLRMPDGSDEDRPARTLRLRREDGLWRITMTQLTAWMEVSS